MNLRLSRQTRDSRGRKYAICPLCGRAWLTGKRGGGLVVGSANRHVSLCKGRGLTPDELNEARSRLHDGLDFGALITEQATGNETRTV